MMVLSRLIDIVNERFGTDFNQADQLFFDQIVEAAMADETLIKQAAEVNPEDKFELVFRNVLELFFVERMDQNEEIFVRFMNPSEAGQGLARFGGIPETARTAGMVGEVRESAREVERGSPVHPKWC